MARPFEDPRKTEMRARCEVAIDAAGFMRVTDLIPIAPKPEAKLRSRICGDLQSLDANETRYCYYLRTSGKSALAKWLADLASAAQQVGSCYVYVVVDETSPILERSCVACGAGLVRLTEDDTFDHIVDASTLSPAARHREFQDKVNLVHRKLDEKLNRQLSHLERNYHQVNEITQGMEPDRRDEYIGSVTRSIDAWQAWGEMVAKRIDEALATDDEDLLRAAERMVEEGAVIDEGGGEAA